jgi:hypothetical protein
MTVHVSQIRMSVMVVTMNGTVTSKMELTTLAKITIQQQIQVVKNYFINQ